MCPNTPIIDVDNDDYDYRYDENQPDHSLDDAHLEYDKPTVDNYKPVDDASSDKVSLFDPTVYPP